MNVYIMYRRLIWILLPLSVLIMVSCGGAPAEAPGQQTRQGPPTTSVRGVVVDTLEVANEIIVPGTFEAYEQLNITPEIAGLIRKINFSEGTVVNRGQLLISMDDREIRGEISRLELEIKLAEDESQRAERLFSIQAISEEELLRTKNREATLIAEKDLLEVRKSKLNVYAPFTGQVGLRHISEGNFVSPGTRIATLHQLNPIKLDFDVPETYIEQLGVGSKVTFTTVGGRTLYDATIYAVEPGVNPQTRTMRMRARVENRDGRFLPGRFAQIRLRVDVSPGAVMVPSEAVIPVIEGQMLFVSRNGKAEGLSVRTGIRTENAVQILEGLHPGDTVITTGLMSLAEGANLKVDLVDFSFENNY